MLFKALVKTINKSWPELVADDLPSFFVSGLVATQLVVQQHWITKCAEKMMAPLDFLHHGDVDNSRRFQIRF